MQMVPVTLEPSEETKTILLGHVIGTFEAENYKGDVTAAGKILRVHVDGYAGYVDMDMSRAVNRAVEIILANHRKTT